MDTGGKLILLQIKKYRKEQKQQERRREKGQRKVWGREKSGIIKAEKKKKKKKCTVPTVSVKMNSRNVHTAKMLAFNDLSFNIVNKLFNR